MKAIDSMVWNLYSDNKTERLGVDIPLLPDVRALLDRCILFLRNDLEYEWPEDDFFGVERYPALLDMLSLRTLNRRLAESRDRKQRRMQAAGDLNVWPFIRMAGSCAHRCEW